MHSTAADPENEAASGSLSHADNNFAHLSIDASTDLVAMEETLRLAGERNLLVEEVRISIVDNCLGVPLREAALGARGRAAEEQQQQRRRLQFSTLLKTLLQAMQGIEKFTFDSGLTADSNSLPFEAVATVLVEAKALTRLDLSYIHVICDNNQGDIANWIHFFQSAKAAAQVVGTQQSLGQVCLDRCSLLSLSQYGGELEADDIQQNNNNVKGLRAPHAKIQKYRKKVLG